MRRLKLVTRFRFASSFASVASLAAAFASLGTTGCEDGPNQTFSPAPGGAGRHQNGGESVTSVDPSHKDFNSGHGGTNKNELCDAPTKAKVWQRMLSQPIVPPLGGGGLDLSGGPSWQGLTVEASETPVWDANHTSVSSGLCQADVKGDQFGDGNQVVSWGDNGEVWFHYRVSNRKGTFMVFWPGYNGAVTAKSRTASRFGDHTYEIPVNRQVTKDGQPFTLDWKGPKGPNDWRNELYDALLATFAPGLPVDPNCNASRRCILGNFGDVAYFYVPAIGHATWVANQNAAPPTPSIPNRIDGDLAKVLPFAFASPMLKLDREGPVATAGNLGTSSTPCAMKLGLAYSDFLATCVATSGDAQKDGVELNKLLGGMSHNTERFRFDVTGVDINFTNNHLAKDDVTHDNDRPAKDDTATQFTVDQSTLGRIANDYANNDPVGGARDNHGAGMIYLEFARLVQGELNKATGGTHVLGDPACTGAGMTLAQMRANGCTGFEGFVTLAPPALVPDANMKKLALGAAGAAFGLGGMKPGHHTVAFCNDATGDLNADYGDCQDTGDTFPASYARVLSVLGKGKVSNLPLDVQDVRFFWKQWFQALVKYLHVAADTTKTIDAVHAVPINPYAIFFDSIGAGQFELAEYVDRSNVSTTQDPTDIVFTADVRNGIMSGYNFSRDIFRGETALYTSMIDHRIGDDPPGKQDTALLTNMFGSPVLAAAFADHTSATDTTHTAYYCATHLEPGPCKSEVMPTDANGNPLLDALGQPLLKMYEGAFGMNRTAWTLGNTPVKVLKTFQNTASAMVRVPLHKNPYDLTSDPPAAGASLEMLVPWLPKQPGVGFPISLTGTRDKFIETYQADFSGTTITANVDYDYIVDPNTHQQLDAIDFLAVETTDFLGDVFLCRDARTGDLLTARMYSSVSTILDWFATHPGTYAGCQVVIRYSPYGNYADYITSLSSGVRLGITQGGGYGRVVDVTLFVPGQ